MTKMFLLWAAATITIFLGCHNYVEGARILVLYPFASKSHMNFAYPLLEALLERNHHITLISPYPCRIESPNITSHVIPVDWDKALLSTVTDKDSITMIIKNNIPMFQETTLLVETARQFYASDQISKFLSTPQNFDLIIINGLVNEMAFGVVDKFPAPVIHLSANAPLPWHNPLFGNPPEVAYVPNILKDLPNKMSFCDRLNNAVSYVATMVMYNYFYMPLIDYAVRESHPDLGDYIWNLQKKFTSLMLTNSHFAINYPRSMSPAIVPVGGLHCRAPKPLSQDLAEFVDGSGDDGFILFSMGTIVSFNMVPESQRQVLLDVFSKLKQRVLWKVDIELSDVPSNVKLSKWLPQQDLLGHPKCRLFITHGGLLSTQEATWHGVPLVGFPMFGDQDLNMRRVELDGQGIRLKLDKITTESLLAAIKRILDDSSYRTKMQDLSKVFQDQNPDPMENAVFWVENIIRHKGGKHLQSPAVDMNWVQYYLVDVYLFLFAALIIPIYVTVRVLRACCRRKKSYAPKRKQE